MGQYANAVERSVLYDTIGIYTPGIVAPVVANPDGWYTSWANLGAATTLNFFNVRNRSAGLMWNNQDKRDQMAYGMKVQSLGISFFSQMFSHAGGWAVDETFSPEDYAHHVWMNDIPRHAGVTLTVQQDDRLKTHALFCSPGYGITGGGYARGEISTWSTVDANIIGTWDHHLSTENQGVPILNNRWEFPVNLMIPRDANISLTIRLNDWARNLLQSMPWDVSWQGNNDGEDLVKYIKAFAGIQVTLMGERLVQQRGEYHR